MGEYRLCSAVFHTSHLEHFNIQIVYTQKCSGGAKRKRSNAREIGVGQFYWPLSDNLKVKML